MNDDTKEKKTYSQDDYESKGMRYWKDGYKE